jgi:hypothetical protein
LRVGASGTFRPSSSSARAAANWASVHPENSMTRAASWFPSSRLSLPWRKLIELQKKFAFEVAASAI